MIYHVYANNLNIGDWFSAKGIQQLLQPVSVIECFCDAPFAEQTLNILSKATEEDFIIIGGGGLLMNYFTPFWRGFEKIATRIPFAIWGIGCCDLKARNTLPSLDLIAPIMNKSQLCVVRDFLTSNFLSNCNVSQVIQCPSINFLQPRETAEGLLHVNNYSTVGEKAYKFMRRTGLVYAQSKALPYQETNNRKSNEADFNNITLHYHRSSLIISSALHGCIIGICKGLKVLAVSGDRKIDELMKTIGLEEWLLDVNEIDRLPELLEELHTQKMPDKILEEIREKNIGVAEKIKSLIRTPFLI